MERKTSLGTCPGSLFFISPASVFSQKHSHDFIFTVNFVKETVRTDPVPPCWWGPVSQPFNIGAK